VDENLVEGDGPPAENLVEGDGLPAALMFGELDFWGVQLRGNPATLNNIRGVQMTSQTYKLSFLNDHPKI
jgi:hypothetical protein